jgi:GTP cyclohydrolase II
MAGVTDVSSCRLATHWGDAEFDVFRFSHGVEQVALRFESDSRLDAVPLVRIQSECLTGEVFRSQHCDCGDQLSQSMEMMSDSGGLLIYLRGHEGRGIGLYEKIRTYDRQARLGEDTVDANKNLGLPGCPQL